ncbi:trifunctional transcriptional regulator/proline dehydrogenase/L-glutamate gamma-semialdehyde dehydrogenase [Brackiella oedipodis]|uniref:trifunctional transcriptional regulator/proline dehydrogenase/L-glutamate gamma-semialdehyde dehydrogenase n=1 Tax=Brackiella oedipodis TaxID=124225 RepID=UPI00048D547C|nr:trifunctional transcriptional regulator/proline dehydrogenase/L-glutamate gamma-semialdehyde dehydrogenase [Brackiella oedipodis]
MSDVSTTLGIKVDSQVKNRLQSVADKLGCTSHWLHKQALLSFLEQIESGHLPAELKHLLKQGVNEENIDDIDAALQLEQHPPFYHFAQDIRPQSVLRSAITANYRRPETECLPFLLQQATNEYPEATKQMALDLVKRLKKKNTGGGVEGIIQEFSLSSQEGIALMCLAEALLRIPDRATRDALIRDKISNGNWRSHVGTSQSLFVNAAAWGLMITGKLVTTTSEQSLSTALNRLITKGGEPLIRRGVHVAMKMMGEQFVCGQTIGKALNNSRAWENKGFRYSYDMLGEAATTDEDAQRYFKDYEQAIHAIGSASAGKGIYEGAGISIKLSAIHPRYSRSQRDRVQSELWPRLLNLVKLAKSYDIGINIDAEEADRLELSLDLLEQLCFEPELKGWNGVGFVIQAYQKRTPFVIDYLIDLGRRSQHRLMIRLVKGAYWDTEIKRAQVDGMEDYPVYTRKMHTDVSYLACARKLLSAPDCIYPQFATHNAQTLSAIYHMAGKNYYRGQYEFQCLHGMGEGLYEEVVDSKKFNRPCRIYAPVGTHETLLAYLVRRLLENGANTSFVNQIHDDKIDLNTLVADPIEEAKKLQPLGKPHDKIPLPRHLYESQGENRKNSYGLDLSNEHRLSSLSAALTISGSQQWQATPGGLKEWDESRQRSQYNPANHRDIVGYVIDSTEAEVKDAIARSQHQFDINQAVPVQKRADLLKKAAEIMEANTQQLLGLIVREAGKSLPNAIAEVREAVDFLRYYALQIETEFADGQQRPLGPIVCISPWNFPLAIFTGQVAAALAAGNTVLAKPAEQTPLIAAQAVEILYQAGWTQDDVILLPGDGEVGALLTQSPDIAGVMFTGSTEVAQLINRNLAKQLNEDGQTLPLIAETGGQNALIVDSSALAEQVIFDVLNSAFDSAGQRCSALRVLCLQEDVADRTLHMLKQAMHELRVGNPDVLNTDVGPVIDTEAQENIIKHIKDMQAKGFKVEQVAMAPETAHGTFVAPTLIEIDQLSALKREVFGPVLHVLRYKREQLGDLIDQINQTGYGLTFGIHSRIDESVNFACQRIHAGNLYVNRNIVGAIVGVQPFGGQGLSGTGPKAGGPLYLQRLCAEGNQHLPQALQQTPERCLELPGPTGEKNVYRIYPRGHILAIAKTQKGLALQLEQIQASGNQALVLNEQKDWLAKADDTIQYIDREAMSDCPLDMVLYEGDFDMLKDINQQVSARERAIVAVYALSSSDIANGRRYPEFAFYHEQSTSINTAAAGGNAKLMTIA